MDKILHTFVVLAYKESSFLEECVKSVLNQKYKSKVIIATTTDNAYIRKIAKKYKLDVVVGKHTTIGGDFDFAIKVAKTPLVTVAHQDDIYDYEYSYEIVKNYKKYDDILILFTRYYEIKDWGIEFNNINLKIKSILLIPLKKMSKAHKISRKRRALKFGNSIACPSVTFNKEKIEFPVFECDFTCDVDWHAWEKMSKASGRFIYVDKFLMGHRIHEESTTTEIIHNNVRTKEDFEMFKRFWPTWIAKIINSFYVKSEKNNRTSSKKTVGDKKNEIGK